MNDRWNDVPDGVYIPEKTILIPVCGSVDVSGMLPAINHRHFQRMMERKQFGYAYKVYPGAIHARLEHGIGTLYGVRRLIRHFRITDQALVHALEMESLLHDIGHGPFSHEFEMVAKHDHHAQGLERLQEMREVIGAYADFDLVMSLYRREHPLSCFVHDRNFGADKIDYLLRDSHHSGYELALNFDMIIRYLQYQDGQIGVDAKSKETIIALQYSYLRMYNSIYLHRTAKIFSRMLQRALCDCCRSAEGIVSLYDLTDIELMSYLSGHSLYPRLVDRGPYKTAHVFKFAGYEAEERIGRRPFRVSGIDRERLNMWSRFLADPWQVMNLENELSMQLGLEEHEALIVQPGYMDKLLPHDVWLYRFNTGRFESLFEQVPSHPPNLREVAERAFYLNVVVPPDKVAAASKFDFTDFFVAHLG